MATRVFEKLTATGFVRISPRCLIPGDAFRVLDGGIVQSLARELAVDPKLYMAARVAADGVHFPIRVADGSVRYKVVAFDGP